MKSHLLNLVIATLLLIGARCTKAQNPSIPPVPVLQITGENNKEEAIQIDKLSIDVKVVGNLATTTFEMQFYNKNNRVMEGELVFPLSEGASISRFAMDVNGQIREGVPVEKNKGQQVFESIERRQVDPGLLEHVAGNTFRTRVYPIPAKGYKTVVVAYTEEINATDGKSLFQLPLFFDRTIKDFSLTVEVFKQNMLPELIDNTFDNFEFANWEENYKAQANYTNIHLNHQLKFTIPSSGNEYGVFVEKGTRTNDTYFYVVAPMKPALLTKDIPESIAVFWDVSASASGRELEREIKLLQAYLTEMKTGEVELFFFSNTFEAVGSFSVLGGKSPALIEQINTANYDGGTQLGSVDFSKAAANEILLFTDGLHTFGNKDYKVGNKQVTTVSSSSKANYSLLNYLALSTGGSAVNLSKVRVEQAVEDLLNQKLQLVSIEHDNKLSDVYPSIPVEVSNSFSCAGKLKTSTGVLKLNFGYGNRVVKSIVVNIADAPQAANGMLEKVWASKKLWELNLQYESNKEEIRQLGKKYSVITPNTSLIVLETVADYVEYEIEPPVDLLSEYHKLIERKQKSIKQEQEQAIERLLQQYKLKVEWWNTEYVQTPPVPTVRFNGNIEDREYVSETKTVTGVVTVADGEPVPGVTIILMGTGQGVVSDLDGRFSLQIPLNGVLQFSYVGYRTQEHDMEGLTAISVALTEDEVALEELVVGYGVQNRRRNRRAESVEEEAVEEQLFCVVEDSEEIAMGFREEVAKKDVSDKVAEGAIFLKPWTPDAAYLKELEGFDEAQLYGAYLKQKEHYSDVPSYYVDICNLMLEKGLNEEALRVLSNLAEVQLASHELLRVLAHKLEQMEQYEAAIETYKQVLEIRKEEPQSYRDLALVFAKNEQSQEAVDLLWKAVQMTWDGRFAGIEVIMLTEMNSVIAKSDNSLDLNGIDERLLVNLPTDIRVVLNWDADNTDMDLWVTDPYGEKCFYSHKNTRIGGLMSNDFTGGYGPEEFMLKKAAIGTYKVEANYFGSSQQKIAGPVSIYLELYINYGQANEKYKEIIVRLNDSREVVEIGEFEFK